jgi:hypothetical protein
VSAELNLVKLEGKEGCSFGEAMWWWPFVSVVVVVVKSMTGDRLPGDNWILNFEDKVVTESS